MRSRSVLPAAAVVMALVAASCGGGGDATTAAPTTTSSTGAPTTDAPATSSADGEAQPASVLSGDNPPPPGLEAQVGLTVTALTSCVQALNGPGTPGVIEVPPSALARLMFGDLLYERIIVQAESDPTLADRLADLVPVIELAPVTTIDIARPTITLDPGLIGPLRPIAPLPTLTIDPTRLNLPGVTLPPTQTTTTIVVEPPTTIPEVPQTGEVLLCGSGWTANSFLQATVTAPDGTVVEERFEQAGPGGTVFVSWSPGLDQPVGRYVVAVSDGSFTAEAQVDVVAPNRPTIDVLGAEVVRPGEVVKLGLVAFDPGSSVALHFFAVNELEGWTYAGTAPDVVISELGSTVFELQTLEGDPEGVYCALVSDAPPYTCKDVEFELAA